MTFTSTFRDDVAGWRTVNLPFSSFLNEDGATLDLTDVRAISLSAQTKRGESILVDDLRLACSSTMEVTTRARRQHGCDRHRHRADAARRLRV